MPTQTADRNTLTLRQVITTSLPQDPQKRRYTLILSGLVIVLLLVGTPLAVQKLFKSTPSVKLYTVHAQTLTSFVGGGGLTYPQQYLNLAFPVDAQVIKVNVKVGDTIQPGQSLLTLDAAGLSAQLNLAYQQWQVALSYVQNLQAQGAPGQNIANAQQQSDLAKSRYETLNAQLNSSTLNGGNVTSNFTGIVTEIDVQPGQLFKANTVLMIIQDTSNIIVRAQFPLEQYSQVKVGQTVVVEPDSEVGQQLDGKVTSINPSLTSPGNSTFEAWISVPNPSGQLFANESVYARINTQVPLPTVPQLAVLNPESDSYVFVYSPTDKHVHIRHVVIGARDGDRLGINSGLKEGDLVVLVGIDQLNDNQKVNVTQTVP